MLVARTRASAVCFSAGHVLVVRLKDPVTAVEFCVVPGGLVEPGETPAEAAVRETFEETGVGVRVETESEMVARYPFVWAGLHFDTTTHFFGARLTHPARVVPEPTPAAGAPAYQLAALWLPLGEAQRELAFHSEIWAATRSCLAALGVSLD